MVDRIQLHGIQFYGYHGVHDEERKLGQRFLVDVELQVNLQPFETSDDLAAGVDYSQVHAAVLEIGTGDRFRLIETLANRIASTLLRRFPPIRQATVRVTKPAPPLPGILAGVSVEVTRP